MDHERNPDGPAKTEHKCFPALQMLAGTEPPSLYHEEHHVRRDTACQAHTGHTGFLFTQRQSDTVLLYLHLLERVPLTNTVYQADRAHTRVPVLPLLEASPPL